MGTNAVQAGFDREYTYGAEEKPLATPADPEAAISCCIHSASGSRTSACTENGCGRVKAEAVA